MALPKDFFDEDKNYRIRLCMPVDEALVVTPNSKVYPCDSCDRPIWVNETQVIPDADVRIDGDVSVCHACMSYIIARSDEAPGLLAAENSLGISGEEQQKMFRETFGVEIDLVDPT